MVFHFVFLATNVTQQTEAMCLHNMLEFLFNFAMILSVVNASGIHFRQIITRVDTIETSLAIWSGYFSSLTQCSVMCLHESSCVSLLYSSTNNSCKLFNVIYKARESNGDELVKYYILDSGGSRWVPKSCQDLFNCSGTMTDGEYWIYPKATNGQRVKIYCHNMGTGASEYITLMNSNYFIQHDPTNWPIKFQQCQSNYLLPLKKVDFMKVGIQIQNMEINGNDYNFTLLTGSPTISYGETLDCNGESFQDPCPRFSQAVINTTGTGLIVDPTLTWGAIHGWSPEIRNLQRSQDNAQITFHCAGWCGRCGPVSQSIRFQQSDEFSADAQALICNA